MDGTGSVGTTQITCSMISNNSFVIHAEAQISEFNHFTVHT